MKYSGIKSAFTKQKRNVSTFRSAVAPVQQQEAYRNFSASELYCATCQKAVPVREKLLLILPQGELHDYSCPKCGNIIGSKRNRIG